MPLRYPKVEKSAPGSNFSNTNNLKKNKTIECKKREKIIFHREIIRLTQTNFLKISFYYNFTEKQNIKFCSLKVC